MAQVAHLDLDSRDRFAVATDDIRQHRRGDHGVAATTTGCALRRIESERIDKPRSPVQASVHLDAQEVSPLK